MTDQNTPSQNHEGASSRRITATLDLEATEVKDKTDPKTSSPKTYLQKLSRLVIRVYRFLRSLELEDFRRFATHSAAGLLGGALVFLFYIIASFFGDASSQTNSANQQLAERIDQLERLQIQNLHHEEKGQTETRKIEALETKLSTLEKSIDVIAGSGELKDKPNITQAAAISNLMTELEKNFDKKLENYRGQIDSQVQQHISKTADNITLQLTEKIKNQDNNPSAETMRLLLNNTTEELSAKIAQLTKQSEVLTAQITGLQDQNSQLQKKLSIVTMQAGQSDRKIGSLSSEISEIRDHALKQNDAENIVRPVTQRMSSLENRLLNIIQQEQKKQGDTRRAALTIALANLKRAIDRGERFDSELETVRSLAPVALPFPELDFYMEKGVRTISELERSFPDFLQKTLDADKAPPQGSLWQRLTGNAASIVRIRRTGELEGDTTEAILARMEVRIKRGDMHSAISEGKRLKGEAMKSAKPWLAEAQARLNLNEALMRVEMELLSELGTQTQSIASEQSRTEVEKTGSTTTEKVSPPALHHAEPHTIKSPTDINTDGKKE